MYGAVTRWGRAFQHVPLPYAFFDSPRYRSCCPTTPPLAGRFGLLPFRSPLLRKCRDLLPYCHRSASTVKDPFYWFLFLQVLRCFNSLGLLLLSQMIEVYSTGFPHSDISGSKVARHLPETFRSRATSFVVSSSQGIHHTPLGFLLRNLRTTRCPAR